MKYEAILFDFDGVIVDSGADIAAAVNSTLTHFGYMELSCSLLVSFVGNGAERLLSLALEQVGVDTKNMQVTNVQKADFDTFYTWYVDWYHSHSVKKTVLYEGLLPLFEHVRVKNIPIAIVSNKPVAITHAVLNHFKISSFFSAVIGPEHLTHLKPHPEGLALAIKKIEENSGITINPNSVLMVGDSASDIMAGKAYGCKTCAVTSGLGNREELLAIQADITLHLAHDLLYLT